MSATTVPGNPAGGSGGARRTGLVLLTGAGAGFLSGLFGVGGGLVIVPALMTVLGMSQRRAAATSLAAIVLTAAVGSVSYGARGEVSLLAAGLLVVGALVGAQAGVLALRRLPEWTLPWIFIGFAVLVVVSMRLRAPVREAALVLDGPRAAALIVVGVVAGILSGLVGVGGGSVIVPGLELVVGVGDLLARGTSLLVMIPTAVTGTWANLRHGVVDLRPGLVVGLGAVLAAPGGAAAAARISPATGTLLFDLFLLGVVVSTLRRERARRRARVRAIGPGLE